MIKVTKAPAINDKYIQTYILDNPNFDVRIDGTIWTRKTRRKGLLPNGAWRQVTSIVGAYFRLCVRVVGKTKHISIARIVYLKFNGPLNENLVINHIDENKLNNHPSNLELVSNQQNTTYNKTIEDFRSRSSSRSRSLLNHKLDMDKAKEVRQLQASGKTGKELAQLFQVSEMTISRVVRNKRWLEAA